MEPLFKIKRFEFAKDWTISEYFVNGVHMGYGVEDEVRQVKVHGETCIPQATYLLGTRQSPKFSSTFYWSEKKQNLIDAKTYASLKMKGDYRPHDMLWIMNVPGFEYVLIHWGNTDDDTEGCYIVGDQVGDVNGQRGVLSSRVNYMKMYPKVYPVVRRGGQTLQIVGK